MKNKIRNYLLFLVARKECCTKELRDKANKRYPDNSTLIDEIIIDFINNKYVCDDRFLEIFVRDQFNQNYGARRIIQKLQMKGISGYKVNDELDKYDFYEKAKEIKEDRFGDIDDKIEFKELKKKKDYLIRRGFSFDEVKYAFD